MVFQTGKSSQLAYRLTLIVTLLILISDAACAQLSIGGSSKATQTTSEQQADPLGRTTPRGTITAFIHATHREDFVAAERFMQVTPAQRSDVESLAQHLKNLMDRYFTAPLATISDKPTGNLDDGLPLDSESAGFLTIGTRKLDLVLVRVNDPEAGHIWLISSGTLAQVPAMYGAIEESWIERVMPRVLLEHAFLGISAAQWTLWAASIALPLALIWLLSEMSLKVVERVRIGPQSKAILYSWQKSLQWPVCLLITLSVHLITVRSVGTSLSLRVSYMRWGTVTLLVAVTWLIRRVSKLLFERARNSMWGKRATSATSLMLLGERFLNVLIVILAIFAILTVAGIDTKTALAGLGIGGVAVALGAQKSIENLLGAIFLLTDKTLALGDRCSISNRQGTIEDITLRSVRLRTDEQTLLSIPAGVLSQASIENFATREKMLMQTILRLQYGTTAGQLRTVLAETEKLVLNDVRIDPKSLRIRLINFGERAIEIELYLYVQTANAALFYEVREQLLLAIAELVEASGSAFSGSTELLLSENLGGRIDGNGANNNRMITSTVGPTRKAPISGDVNRR